MGVFERESATGRETALGALERSALIYRILGDNGRVARVTTVTAPPGYGKTTLLKQLVSAAARVPLADRPCVLYTSATSCEGHVGLFVAQLEAAARAALPAVDVTSLVQLRTTVQASEYARRLPFVLQRTIAECHTGPTLLLIDDLEELRSGEPLANLISGFIEADISSLNFVFASQTSVPWDVGRLEGHHVALTSRELEFRREEIGRWLKQVSGRPPKPQVVAALHDRTGGWPGVVSLSAMLLRSSQEDDRIEGVLDSDGAEIVASIVDRLLETMESTARYVLRTLSVVEAFTYEQAKELFQSRAEVVQQSAKFIDLPVSEVDRALGSLLSAHLIAATTGGGYQLHKMVREALRERFEAEVPSQAREAHRRTATFLLEAADVAELPVAALEHLAAAQDYERLLDVLEGKAEAFFSAGYHRHLSTWLLALESYYTALPFWANLYLGRVYSQLGEWDRARAYFDRCKSELGERERVGDMWRWQPRLCLGYAAMYWRRGMHSDASTYCRRGLDYLRRLEARPPWGEPEAEVETESDPRLAELAEMKLSLLRLLGTLRLDAGATDLAREVFAEAEREATHRGMHKQRAQALKSLGRLATLRGEISEGASLYEEALGLIQRERDIQEYAEIAQELGTSKLMMGDASSAELMLQEALEIHLSTAHPASIARAWTSLARCFAMNERMERADQAHSEAMRLLDTVGNLRIRAEILDRYAIFLAHQHRTYEAKSVHERASTLIASMVRPEAPLLALHCEATVELYGAQQRDEEALALVTDAVDRYQRLGARFDVARLYWRAAALHHQLFVDDKRETPESVVSYLELASTIANQRSYAFSRLLVGPELVAVGLQFGLPETQAFSARAAQAIESAGGTCVLSQEAVERYQSFQRRLERAEDFVLTSRDGRVGANEAAVGEAIEAHKGDSLVVALADHQMWNYGASISLGQKRVILPLLVHFLQNGDQVFSMAELAESVWDAPELDDTTKTKVKVAISRLRGLLGKGRTYIVTGRRTPPAGRSVVTYGLHPSIRFLLVEPANDPH